MTTRTELVRALAKPGEAILMSLDAHKCHMLHMAVGLSGEAGELADATDRDNVLEELGDALFYLEGLLQGVGSSVEQFNAGHPGGLAWAGRSDADTGVAICIRASELLDDVKKYVIYDKPLDLDTFNKHVSSVLEVLRSVQLLWGFTDEEIHADNLRKLGKRYEPLKYSDAAAHARVDKS